MKILLFLLLVTSIQLSAYAAGGFSTLEERMSGKEFTEAGLDKLSKAELAALNEWVRRHSVATLDYATTPSSGNAMASGPEGDMRGFDNQPQNDELDKVINATIDGVFEGWSGKGTLFKLTNGMIWEQDENDSFSSEPIQGAQVTIRKSLMGNWHLSVAGYRKKVQVIRIQ